MLNQTYCHHILVQYIKDPSFFLLSVRVFL